MHPDFTTDLLEKALLTATNTTQFWLDNFVHMLDHVENDGTIPFYVETTSSSFIEMNLLNAYTSISDSLIIINDSVQSYLSNYTHTTAFQHIMAVFQECVPRYNQIKATQWNTAHLHQDYENYYQHFVSYLTQYHANEAIFETDRYGLDNTHSLRQFLHLLSKETHSITLQATSTTYLDNVLIQHMPQAFIDRLSSWNNPLDMLQEREPRTHWWWYREGYAERGR